MSRGQWIWDANRKDQRTCPKCRAVMNILGKSDDGDTLFLLCPECSTGGECASTQAVVKLAGSLWWKFVKAMYGWTKD